MNIGQLMAELEERDMEIEAEVEGSGPIVSIEMTDDGRYILIGEHEC